jgi:hypothetical protein
VFLFEDGAALMCVMCRYLQVGDITVLVRNISHFKLGMRGVSCVLLRFFGTVSLLRDNKITQITLVWPRTENGRN